MTERIISAVSGDQLMCLCKPRIGIMPTHRKLLLPLLAAASAVINSPLVRLIAYSGLLLHGG